MNVVIINRSDALGGAAIASMRLCDGLNAAGAEARLLVVDRRSRSASVLRACGRARAMWSFAAERAGVLLHNGQRRDTLFRIDPATHGLPLWRQPAVLAADVVVLGWVNQGMLSIKGVRRLVALGKPVVWVMHDMWPATGVCHHNEQCRGLADCCAACPLLPDGSGYARRVWERKRDLYAGGGLHFVAVSRWLERQCRESALLRHAPITTIPNALDTSRLGYAWLDDNPWGVERGRQVMVMGAARLDDPVKGFDRLVEALRLLATERPEAARRLHLVLYGDIRDAWLLQSLAVPYTHLGYVTDLEQVYRHAHIVVSASTRESFGYTLAEGMACGCVAVTTGEGGQTDIVRHLTDGYVTPTLSPADLARGIAWALDARLNREQQHSSVASRFDCSVIADSHIGLYRNLLGGNWKE